MGFEEIKAGLEKYTKDFEESFASFAKACKPIINEANKPIELGTICPCCGKRQFFLKAEHETHFPLFCIYCTKRIINVHKQLIEKGFAFKHGFEKVV